MAVLVVFLHYQDPLVYDVEKHLVISVHGDSHVLFGNRAFNEFEPVGSQSLIQVIRDLSFISDDGVHLPQSQQSETFLKAVRQHYVHVARGTEELVYRMVSCAAGNNRDRYVSYVRNAFIWSFTVNQHLASLRIERLRKAEDAVVYGISVQYRHVHVFSLELYRHMILVKNHGLHICFQGNRQLVEIVHYYAGALPCFRVYKCKRSIAHVDTVFQVTVLEICPFFIA